MQMLKDDLDEALIMKYFSCTKEEVEEFKKVHKIT